MTYPALELFVQAYLNLDWGLDYEDVWEAVDDFVANAEEGPQLPDDVARLLAAMPSEEQLSAFIINDLRSGYSPEADGLTMTEWLTAVRQRAEDALTT